MALWPVSLAHVVGPRGLCSCAAVQIYPARRLRMQFRPLATAHATSRSQDKNFTASVYQLTATAKS